MASSPQNKEKDTTRRIIQLFRPNLQLLIFALILTAISSGLQLAIIGMAKPFIDKMVTEVSPSELKGIIFKIMTLFVLFGLTHGAGFYISVLFGQRVVVYLRSMIFAHLQDLNLRFFEDRKTGGIMSWITNDVNVFRNFSANQLNSLVSNGVQVLGSLGMNFFISWKLSLISILIVPLLGLVIHNAGTRMREATRKVQEKLADISAVLQEVVAAIPIIRSFGTEKHEMGRFNVENEGTFVAEMKKARISSILQPAIQLVVAMGLLAILLVGIDQVTKGKLTVGELFVFVALLNVMSERAIRLGQSYGNFNEVLAAGDRIFDFIDIQTEIKEVENPIILNDIKGNVEYKNVSFSYDGKERVLHHIDLHVPSGKMIAFVGPSGSGKSSLVKLLPRFYDTDEGQLLIDGNDIKQVSISSLRAQMGIVPQETILFSTTISENIAYGKLDASKEEIIAAAKAANAHDFIEKLPDGYNTIVGERGSKLSGGQAQRISIARAILKNPRILILDEATSSLDAQSEELVQQALEKLMHGRTTFVIAHRLTTVQDADEIIVLQAGRIVQRGTHDELMKIDGLYRSLYQVQASGADDGITASPSSAPIDLNREVKEI